MIPISRPSIVRVDMDAVLTRLANDSIGPGEVAREFASSLARYVGRRGGVAFRSYGAAVEAVIGSLGLESGARIGVSVFLPRAFPHILQAAGFSVVYLDVGAAVPVLPPPLEVDFTAFGIDAIVADTRLGFVPDLENLTKLRIPVVEEISEGLGANTGDRMVGSFGDATIVDVEPDKMITAGGGTVVLSNSTRRLSALQQRVDATVGNLPLPDMNAAMGLTQVKQIERFLERRQQLASRLMQAVLKGGNRMVGQTDDAANVMFQLPVWVNTAVPEVMSFARHQGVQAESISTGSVLEELRESFEVAEIMRRFPNALEQAAHVVCFPLFPTMSGKEVQHVERVLASLP